MSLMACPECSHEVSSNARACPQCGGPIHAHGLDRAKRIGLLVAAALFIASAVALWIVRSSKQP